MHVLPVMTLGCDWSGRHIRCSVSWLDQLTGQFEYTDVDYICHAECNQIDEPLLNLLKQNPDAARAAGQPEPAEFMEKIRDAARKFLIK